MSMRELGSIIIIASTLVATDANSTAYWLKRRALLVESVLGVPSLPNRSTPDAIRPLGPMFNTTPGVEALVWNLTDPMYFEIESTVFFSPVTPGKRSKHAWLFHHGHSPCVCPSSFASEKCEPGCWSSLRPDWKGHSWWDLYNVSSFIHSLGCDVYILSMPSFGVNFYPDRGYDHWWYLQWEERGDHPLRYYLEPVFLTINHAKAAGYEHVFMAGLSGGGWTTTFAAAMDPRIRHSFPIAGSLPCAMRDPESGKNAEDFEQSCNPNPNPTTPAHPGRPAFAACNYTCQYLLAGLEPGRYQLQILHEHDNCCFPGDGVHSELLAYEHAIRAELMGSPAHARADPRGHGWFSVASDDHVMHEVAPMDKTLIAAAHTAELGPGDARWGRLPCDLLHNPTGECPWPPSASVAADRTDVPSAGAVRMPSSRELRRHLEAQRTASSTSTVAAAARPAPPPSTPQGSSVREY